MAYHSQKDIDKYNGYVRKIDYERVGSVVISGIYEKGNPFAREEKVLAYAYKIFDNNLYCPDRDFVTSPGSSFKNGIQTGLVVMLAYNKETKSFIFHEGDNLGNVKIANPAAVWIASNYNGACEEIAKEAVQDHQASFHEKYCAHSKSGKELPVLRESDINSSILPQVIREYPKCVDKVYNMEADVCSTMQLEEGLKESYEMISNSSVQTENDLGIEVKEEPIIPFVKLPEAENVEVASTEPVNN